MAFELLHPVPSSELPEIPVQLGLPPLGNEDRVELHEIAGSVLSARPEAEALGRCR